MNDHIHAAVLDNYARDMMGPAVTLGRLVADIRRMERGELRIVSDGFTSPGQAMNAHVSCLTYVVKDWALLASFDEMADRWATLGEGKPGHAAFVAHVRAVVAAAPPYDGEAECTAELVPPLALALWRFGNWYASDSARLAG